MINEFLKKFIHKSGLSAIEKIFNGVPSLFVGKDSYKDSMVGTVYKDGIFIFQENENWFIGFSQSAKTRALTIDELKSAILSWKAGKSLREYE